MTAPGPRGGDDTCGLIDDALATLAKRRGAWLGDDLTVIAVLASLIDQAGRCLLELVTNARLHRHSWDQIARALATSPDEVRLRFDPESPIADPRWPYDLQPKFRCTQSAGPREDACGTRNPGPAKPGLTNIGASICTEVVTACLGIRSGL